MSLQHIKLKWIVVATFVSMGVAIVLLETNRLFPLAIGFSMVVAVMGGIALAKITTEDNKK